MSEPLVVESIRSGFVESTHLVDVAVVDTRGSVVAWAGDPSSVAAFRSSAKPIQARAALEAGWVPADARALAIACASHNGEPEHIEEVRRVLAHAGVGEDALACPDDVPAYMPAAIAAGDKRAIYHNCSGKHAAMLGACAAAGWRLDGYRSPDHPLQKLVRGSIAKLLGSEGDVLVDGCGVPTTTAPLHAFARAFLAIDDGGPAAAAMRAHPFLVGGTDRLDTDLMNVAPHVLSKGGAEGLACVASNGLGVALKIRDGDLRSRARGAAVLFVLRALDLIADEHRAKLEAHDRTPVLGGGLPVGSVCANGALTRS